MKKRSNNHCEKETNKIFEEKKIKFEDNIEKKIMV
jgi:hypothetical protein